MMKKRLFFLMLSFAVTMQSQKTVKTISIDPRKSIASINPLFWGANFLFWIDDDKSLWDGKVEKALKDIPCRVLRYPGGTVADNFHWATGMLDNTAMFPYEDGEAETDFDEFMGFCQRVGAEPLLVVNTQSWYLKNNIEGGAREAADWVRYCKKKGYRVKYWEIGNETYWHPVMTAKEYGKLVNAYAKAMKAVDPNILIGANGHWNVRMVGAKERTPQSHWEEIRLKYMALQTTEESKAFKEYCESLMEKPNTKGDDKWWEDVAESCGENIDMLSIHWYFFGNQLPFMAKRIQEVEALFKEKYPHKEYLICLSEYNCNEKETVPRVLSFFEGLGCFLEAGVDIATFWPMRIGGYKNRSMLDMESKRAQYPHTIIKLLSSTLKGQMVACRSDKDCRAFASVDGEKMTIVLSGRQLKKACDLKVDLNKFNYKNVEAMQYQVVVSPYADVKKSLVAVKASGQTLRLTLKPETFIIVRLQ